MTGVVSRGCRLLWPLASCKVIALGRLLLLRPLCFLFLVRSSKYRPFFPSCPAVSRCFFFWGQLIFLDGSQTGRPPPLCCFGHFVGFPPEVADAKDPGAPGGLVRPAAGLGCAPWGARPGRRLVGASAALQGPRGWAGRTPLLLPSPRRQSPRIDESSCLLQGDGWVYFNPLWKAH